MIATVFGWVTGKATPYIMSLVIAGVGSLTAYVYHVKLQAADVKVAGYEQMIQAKDALNKSLADKILQITADAREQKQRADQAASDLSKFQSSVSDKIKRIDTEIKSHATAQDRERVSPAIGGALDGVLHEYAHH